MKFDVGDALGPEIFSSQHTSSSRMQGGGGATLETDITMGFLSLKVFFAFELSDG